MRLLTAAEQRELDRLAAEAGLPTRVLMESAGAAVAREVLALRPARVAVFCGPGNNGGDGFVCARFLRDALQSAGGSGEPVVVVATAREKLKGDALAAAQAWTGPVASVADAPRLGRGDAVVDAIFGSGLSRPRLLDKPGFWFNAHGSRQRAERCRSQTPGRRFPQANDRARSWH